MWLNILLAVNIFIYIEGFMFIWKAPVLMRGAAAAFLMLIACHAYFLLSFLQPHEVLP